MKKNKKNMAAIKYIKKKIKMFYSMSVIIKAIKMLIILLKIEIIFK